METDYPPLLDPFTPFEEPVETDNRTAVADHLEVALKYSSEEAKKLGGELIELLMRLSEKDGRYTKDIHFETTLEDGRPLQAVIRVDEQGENKTLEVEILPIRSDQFGFGTVGNGECGDLCELRIYLGAQPSGLKTLPFFEEEKPEHNSGKDIIATKSRAMGLYTELLEIALENAKKHFGADVAKV